MLILFILLHEGDEGGAVGTLADRLAVVREHPLRQLLQRFFRAPEFDDRQVELGDHAVQDGVAV